MKWRAYTALLFGIAMFLGCGPTLQVKTDFDHNATFQQYRSRSSRTASTSRYGTP